MEIKSDQHFMSLALQLARKGMGRVEPNPMVGCVIVKSGKIIAQGYHKKFGGPHAEIEALKKINFKAKGATMYVTLEPCCHFGKTPPCVDAVIKSGVKRVVIGMKDPNPVVNGRSVRKLKRAGIEVTVGVSPYIIVKIAQSSDGKIAAKKGARTQITGKVAQAYVQKLRTSVDAILVGANTVRIDDPQLNVRDRKKKQPLRIVLSKSGKVDPESKIFRTHGGRVIMFSNSPIPLLSRGGFLRNPLLRRGGRGSWPIGNLLKSLSALGVRKIFVEGGAQIFSHFLKSNLVDEWHVVTSSVVLGEKGVSAFGIVDRQPLTVDRWLKKKGFEVGEKRMLGKDELVIYRRK